MEPVINFEEKIGKTVGRRLKPNPLSVHTSTKAAKRGWRKAFGGPRIPKGVYRFKTHEEAHAWMMNELTRPRTS